MIEDIRCFRLITTSISVYRGKSSILEYLVGGGVTGALYKFSMGPRGMLVGGALGNINNYALYFFE